MRLFRVLMVLGTMFGVAGPVLAQDGPVIVVDAQIGKGSPGMEGVAVGIIQEYAARSTYSLNVAGDFGVLHHSFGGGGYTDKTLFGGVLLKRKTEGKIVPYGEFMGGIISCCGATDFGLKYGGGIVYGYNEKYDFRVRFNLITGFYDFGSDTGFLIGGGIAWKLGS